jgi:HAD superfamily hydrolase (TIGR01509 family)
MMMMSTMSSSAARVAPVTSIRRRTTTKQSSPIVTGSSRRCASVVANASSSTTSNPRFALLFDCDGVIVETEELHRLAYNGAFEAFELKIDGTPVEWVVEYYDVLQNTVGGGKPKMKWHFGQNAWPTSTMFAEAPTSDEDRDALVDALQDKKTEIYKKIVEEIAVARPGVLRLMDEAIADPSIAVGICSAATKAGFEKVVNSVVGADRLSRMDVVMAGDDVVRKKPDPLIYNLARERIGISADKCVVVEDSLVGLRAAVGASMHCVITPTSSTASADFLGEGAKKVVADLGEDASVGVTIAKLFPIDAAEPNFNF